MKYNEIEKGLEFFSTKHFITRKYKAFEEYNRDGIKCWKCEILPPLHSKNTDIITPYDSIFLTELEAQVSLVDELEIELHSAKSYLKTLQVADYYKNQ